MKDLTINAASIDERKWAAALMAGSEPWISLNVGIDQCIKACTHPAHMLYIASFKSNPAGLILLHPQGVAGSPYIKSICVTSAVRSQGVGAGLVDFAENLFRPESKHIFLCVSSFNNKAQLFYHRLGYQQVGEFKDYIIKGESEILMCKRLK